MKKIEVSNETPESFSNKVNDALQKRALGKLVSVTREGQNLLIKFDKLGTSEIYFHLTETAKGFTAVLTKEKIAFTHKAFRSEIENKLEKVLTRLGAFVVN